MDGTLLSSPDPLNDSPTFYSPVRKQSRRVQKSLPLQGSSPKKQTFQLDVGNQLSPQKIRVTVEAEPPAVQNGQRSHQSKEISQRKSSHISPVRQNIRTTTTTIPVKGLSDSEDDTTNSYARSPKRGRGRPRKSTGTPVPAKGRVRNLTPGGKQGARRRRTLGDLVDGDDPDDWDFAIGTGVEVSRGKGRSRSRSIKGAAQSTTTPSARQTEPPEKVVSSTTGKKGHGRRKTLSPEEILIHEDDVETAPNTASEEGILDDVDTKGVLAPRNMNLGPTQSAFSTIRSATTVDGDDPDVLLAKFSPAKKTPAKTGWSSPRFISAGKTIQTSSKLSPIALPSSITLSPGNVNQEALGQSNIGGGDESEEGHCYEEDVLEVVSELPEFDTILESEGFSMISVDSVPSLREHLSSPYSPNETARGIVSPAMNAGVLHNQDIPSAVPDDSFSSLTPEILEAATPRRKPSHSILRTVKQAICSGESDSFSSIPPEILEAATPARKASNSKILAISAKERIAQDDSFSSIPSAILQAATPAKHWQTSTKPLKALPVVDHIPNPGRLTLSIPSGPSGTSEKRSHNSSGLLSPDKTPSPIEQIVLGQATVNRGDFPDSSMQNSDKLYAVGGSSVLYPPLKSSPPSVAPRRYTYTAHLRQQRSLYPDAIETPSIVFSSPSLPPLIQNIQPKRSQVSTTGDSQNHPQSSLSPIVRAGRVLQDIAISPSSRSRSQSLGSPFKSPATLRISGGTSDRLPEPDVLSNGLTKPSGNDKRNDGDIFVGFSDDTRRELRRSLMIGEELAQSQSSSQKTTNWPGSDQGNDPFGSDCSQVQTPWQKGKGKYTLELPRQKSSAHLRHEDHNLGQGDTIRSEGAMSWQAEDTVSLDVPSDNSAYPANTATAQTIQDQRKAPQKTTSRQPADLFQYGREIEWARERARVSSQIESASISQVIVISSDDQTFDENCITNGEEEDIWQAQAHYSSSVLEERAQNIPVKEELKEKPRRSKIPSPWRKNSKRLVYSDELAPLSSLSQSDALVPGAVKVTPKAESILSKATLAKQDLFPDSLDNELSESSVVWHIPQKTNFAPRPRNSENLDISVLLASSPLKLPQLSPQMLQTPRTSLFGASKANLTLSAGPESRVSPEDSASVSCSYEDELSSVSQCSEVDGTADSVNSTNDSEAESETEPANTFHTPAAIHYPTLRSPTKSCLRNASAPTSPTKSVAFHDVSPATHASSPQRLSGTEWSKQHWLLLREIYWEAKSWPDYRTFDEQVRVTQAEAMKTAQRELKVPSNPSWRMKEPPSKLVGAPIAARGTTITMTNWHMDIVSEFRYEIPEWDEQVITRRLFAIILGEEHRRLGIMK